MIELISQTEFEQQKAAAEAQQRSTCVHFNADYDIHDVLLRFGNWSRRGLYLKQNTISLYNAQSKDLKETCSDNDAQIINKAILLMLSLNNSDKNLMYDITMLYYFGEKQVIEDYIPNTGIAREIKEKHIAGKLSMISAKDFYKSEIFIVKPLTIREISKKLGISKEKVRALKSSAEDFLVGCLATLEKLSGYKLDVLNCSSFIQS